MAEGEIERIEIERLSEVKDVLGAVVENSKKLPGLTYADIRIRVDDGPIVVAENGAVRAARRDFDCCYGIRVLALDGMIGLGYCGGRIGVKEFNKTYDILYGAVNEAYKRARVNGKLKSQRKKSYGEVGDSLISTMLAPTEIHQDIVLADFSEDPRKASLEELCERAVKVTESMLKTNERTMKKAEVIMECLMNRELFCNTEGAFIDEAYAKTQALVAAVAAAEGKIPETYYDVIGNMHGLEVLDGRNMYNQSLETFALGLANDTIKLSEAPILEGRFENAKVVTDGHFNSLWVHENVGHPSEADRCLGMETGYAGRSWFFRDAENNQIGKAIASPLLNVCSRNDLDAYGKFKYDGEGVKGTKIYHIKDGIFKGFLHSRWTAFVMDQMGVKDQIPNGSMRATNALDVPYIRMKQTGIEGGTWNPMEIIAAVDDGFYLVGERIPSMSESRENFRISARKTYKIKDGKLVQMYRGGGLTADAKPYMMSIWAVGKDVGLYNIFNCGKALPMQTMYMCNFAPTMGAKGTVIGGLKKE